MNMAESFETYRSYLFAIAYRMLGSAMDAEDMVQETYLRYRATPPETITSLKAFLTTIITRLCMDQLHLARRNREQYLGPWLPEPLLTAEALEAVSPEEHVDREESISLAFLLLLEQLQPVERAVFLLREIFEYDYAEIATFLGRRCPGHIAVPLPHFSVWSARASTSICHSEHMLFKEPVIGTKVPPSRKKTHLRNLALSHSFE